MEGFRWTKGRVYQPEKGTLWAGERGQSWGLRFKLDNHTVPEASAAPKFSQNSDIP